MKVIVTMTTVPSRMDSVLPQTLRILANLNYHDYELHLNLPKKYSKTGETYVVPKWLHTMERVKVYTGLDDLGPKTKITPTLMRVDEPDAVIITADDDILYNRDFINYHLKKREDYPDRALGFSGIINKKFVMTPRKDTDVDMLDNYKTASYTRSMFGRDFFDHYAPQTWNDDIAISAYFRDKGITKTVLAYDKETNFMNRVRSFPVLNVIECPMTGCDLIRGHAMKNTTDELQQMYDGVKAHA